MCDVRDRYVLASRAYDQMEPGGPTENTLAALFRERRVEEHALVWAAHQLERWTTRLAEERGETPPEPEPWLRNVRNALEHLDETNLQESYAVPDELRGPKNGGSLARLDNERLPLFLGGPQLFGSIDPVKLEAAARRELQKVNDRLMARAEALWLFLQED